MSVNLNVCKNCIYFEKLIGQFFICGKCYDDGIQNIIGFADGDGNCKTYKDKRCEFVLNEKCVFYLEQILTKENKNEQ